MGNDFFSGNEFLITKNDQEAIKIVSSKYWWEIFYFRLDRLYFISLLWLYKNLQAQFRTPIQVFSVLQNFKENEEISIKGSNDFLEIK